jgi:hypothetical protein
MKDDVITSMYAGNVEVRLIRDGSVRIVITDYDASGGYVNGYEVEEFCKSYTECVGELRVINALKALFDIGGNSLSAEFEAMLNALELTDGTGWSRNYGHFVVTHHTARQRDVNGENYEYPILTIIDTESNISVAYERRRNDDKWWIMSESIEMYNRRMNNG